MKTSFNTTASPQKINNHFYNDVIQGLTTTPKRLDSKYFYDAEGDQLFQQIMRCPEYYLTRCEQEILSTQAIDMAQTILQHTRSFDLVELGPGDASKTLYLLQALLQQDVKYTYFPIDISSSIIDHLETTLPQQLPLLNVHGLHGDFTEMLSKVAQLSNKKNKVVLFMGASIGNIARAQVVHFCARLREQLQPGDLLMIGFDLKKHPKTILDAYNDSQGITKAFNLNLLKRINRELNADFVLDQFDHYPTYDPFTGSCRSYLVSLKEQIVHIGEEMAIRFEKDECIHTELSQKYTMKDILQLSEKTGFEPVASFYDNKKWFVDVLWK